MGQDDDIVAVTVPQPHVIGLRLRVASSLLRDTGLPIAEIMARVGYENGSNFTRTFRGAFGQTPREHRRMTR